jgi:GAF domain-containing protein
MRRSRYRNSVSSAECRIPGGVESSLSLTARVAVTSKRTSDLELFQLQADQGPCLDCHTTGQTVAVADVQAEARRWLRFTSAATEAGIDSVHAVPMRAGGTVLGALGLFSTDVVNLTTPTC